MTVSKTLADIAIMKYHSLAMGITFAAHQYKESKELGGKSINNLKKNMDSIFENRWEMNSVNYFYKLNWNRKTFEDTLDLVEKDADKALEKIREIKSTIREKTGKPHSYSALLLQ